jgi:hypothetical protein
MSDGPPRVDLPGIDDGLRADIETRIAEFEALHQASVLADGPGWVPRLRRSDYLWAVAVNVLIIVWLVVALVGGGGV